MLMLESRLLVVRCCVRLLLVGAAVTYSALAPALGLGEITLHSALNQPLRADIALVDAAGLEEGELSVSLATADEFSRAGVERVFFLNDLKFTPVLRGNRSLVRVTSNKPVNEPFLNFLVQLNQPNGRLLREYTVLIDPPGSPGIEPASDEPWSAPRSSEFPVPAKASPPAQKSAERQDPSVAAPQSDPLAEQLAASVLQNQQMQANIDELNAKLQAQDEQIAGQKKQVSELQARLVEVQQGTDKPVAPAVEVPAPVIVEEPGTGWPLIFGLVALVVLLGGFVWRRRQQVQSPASAFVSQSGPELEPATVPRVQLPVLQPVPGHSEETPVGDVVEAVGIYLTYGRFAEAIGLLHEAMVKEPQRSDLPVQLLEVLGKQGDVAAFEAQEASLRNAGYDEQKLQIIRARHPRLNPVAPVAAAASVTAPQAATIEATPDEAFQLNLDDLSLDSNWDLIGLSENSSSAALPVSESTLLQPEIEWRVEPVSQALDDSFLDEFKEPDESLELEPLEQELADSSDAGKLEQARTCIDDGELESAIELLNELLKDAEEPFRQTACSLLAGIRQAGFPGKR
jgi:FimV-like protein